MSFDAVSGVLGVRSLVCIALDHLFFLPKNFITRRDENMQKLFTALALASFFTPQKDAALTNTDEAGGKAEIAREKYCDLDDDKLSEKCFCFTHERFPVLVMAC